MKNLPSKIIVLDTEFIGLNQSLIYDLGYIVAELDTDKMEYEPIHTYQAVLKQVYDNRPLFSVAHYNKKRPKYISLLKGHKAKRHYVGHAFNTLQNVIDRFEVDCVLAYSCKADEKAFKQTSEQFGTNNPLENIAIYDLHGICTPIYESKDYKEFAKEHNQILPSGLLPTNVQAGCRFIYNDPNYEEEHTALSDCYNELDLLNVALKGGAEIKEYKSPMVQSGIKQPLHIIVMENGEQKNYTYHYKTKRSMKKSNTIRLTR